MGNDNYLKKDISYFINPRLDLVSLMPRNPDQKVLEIGMGGGDTLVHIKEQKLAAEVIGIDIIHLPDTNQQNPVIDEVHYIDLDKDALPFQDNYFDVIIAGDVLEHLVDPWDVLKKLTQVLKVGGCILVSLPNIRDVYALYSILIQGRFAYTKSGIFDKTHMRFFCKKDMVELIEYSGKIGIETIMPIHEFGSQNYKRKIFNKLSFKIFEQFLTSQYLFKAIKK